jgi:predicted protein tyrosine phosphatase
VDYRPTCAANFRTNYFFERCWVMGAKMVRLALLTVCGLDELDHHCAKGITHVLSLLDPGWPEPEAFWAYGPHHRVTLHFHDTVQPGPDLVLPTIENVETILGFGRSIIAQAERHHVHLLVHCHAGISRSTAAMAILLAQAGLKGAEDSVFGQIQELRPQAWPNSLMIGLADELLGRKGRLSAALDRFYTRQIRSQPGTAQLMQTCPRGARIEMGRVA